MPVTNHLPSESSEADPFVEEDGAFETVKNSQLKMYES